MILHAKTSQCPQYHGTYGDVQEKKQPKAGFAGKYVTNYFRDRCAQECGIIEDRDIFASRNCIDEMHILISAFECVSFVYFVVQSINFL